MSYPGEPGSYQRSMNKLAAYNLRRPPPSEGESFGASLGGAISRAPSGKSGDKDKPEKPTHGAEMYDKYVDATNAHMGMAQMGKGPFIESTWNPGFQKTGQEMLEDADKSVHINKIAEEARMGGTFTTDGLEKAAKEAELNAHDRLRLKSMIGLAGTNVPLAPGAYAPGMGPGGF